MDVMQLRRQIMLAAGAEDDYAIGTLKYWWRGEDSPVNGKWYDCVSGMPITLYNGAAWDSANKLYDFSGEKYGAIRTLNRVTLRDNSKSDFNIGKHFRFVFDKYAKITQNSRHIHNIDLSAIDNASKGIQFSVGATFDSNNNPIVSVSIGWKMQGNASNPGLGANSSIPSNVPFNGDPFDFNRFRGYFEIHDKGNGYDEAVAVINGIRYVWPADVPKVTYGPTWKGGNGESGWVGRGQLVSAQYYTYSNEKVMDFKFYVID